MFSRSSSSKMRSTCACVEFVCQRLFVSSLRNDAPLFLGTYEHGLEYQKGDWVVSGGSTWACLTHTKDAPGTKSSAWMIVARKGSDGKDSR